MRREAARMTTRYGDEKQDVYYGDGQPVHQISGHVDYDHLEQSVYENDYEDDVWRSAGLGAYQDRTTSFSFPQQENSAGKDGLVRVQKPAWSGYGVGSALASGSDFGNPQKQMSATVNAGVYYQGYGESYSGGIVRSEAVDRRTQHHFDFGGPIEMNPGQSRLVHNKAYPIKMASDQQFRKRAQDELFFNEELEDESSEDGMMADENEEEAPGSFAPLPDHYRRDSTFQSTVSGPKTVNAIERVLMGLGKSTNHEQVSCSQFTGQFYEEGRCCDFIINTYQGANTREQIWVELKNLNSSVDSIRAFGVLFNYVVENLSQRGIIGGLVDRDYQPFTPLQKESAGEANSPDVDELEVRRLIQDRVCQLKQAKFLATQQVFSEEILFMAEQYPGFVAESPELAPVLGDLLRKNAKSDIHMSRTILRLIRALLAYSRFEEGLKCVTSGGKPLDPVKLLLQTAMATKNCAWKADLFKTVVALQKVGFKCEGKRANAAYSRIKGLVGAVS